MPARKLRARSTTLKSSESPRGSPRNPCLPEAIPSKMLTPSKGTAWTRRLRIMKPSSSTSTLTSRRDRITLPVSPDSHSNGPCATRSANGAPPPSLRGLPLSKREISRQPKRRTRTIVMRKRSRNTAPLPSNRNTTRRHRLPPRLRWPLNRRGRPCLNSRSRSRYNRQPSSKRKSRSPGCNNKLPATSRPQP